MSSIFQVISSISSTRQTIRFQVFFKYFQVFLSLDRPSDVKYCSSIVKYFFHQPDNEMLSIFQVLSIFLPLARQSHVKYFSIIVKCFFHQPDNQISSIFQVLSSIFSTSQKIRCQRFFKYFQVFFPLDSPSYVKYWRLVAAMRHSADM